MTSYTDDYRNLLIKQYWDKPKARAEIEGKSSIWEGVKNFLDSFIDEFDIDQATGDRLDIIGRVVGISRVVPLVLPKIAFGFDENANARGFDDKFITVADRAPFLDRFGRIYTDLQLDDPTFRLFIKAKISKNVASPYVANTSGETSMQDAINTLFEGGAYIVDKFDMTLRLYVSPAYNEDRLRAIQRLNLLPKPQGVRYDLIVLAAPSETFGFSDNPNALGFADKFDAAKVGGKFALKVI